DPNSQAAHEPLGRLCRCTCCRRRRLHDNPPGQSEGWLCRVRVLGAIERSGAGARWIHADLFGQPEAWLTCREPLAGAVAVRLPGWPDGTGLGMTARPGSLRRTASLSVPTSR